MRERLPGLPAVFVVISTDRVSISVKRDKTYYKYYKENTYAEGL
jgi:hypothetical protein